VRVDAPGEASRIFVYAGQGGSSGVIREYDETGTRLHTYRYDPEGRVGDLGRFDGSSGSSGSNPLSPPDAGSKRSVPWTLVALLVALVGAVVAGAWALTRSKEPAPERTWAERLSDRLDHEGEAHGRARRHDETVVDYTRTLGDSLLPDPRVATVGAVVSSALFSRREPPPETRTWAEGVVDEVAARHPAPSWTDRLRPSRRRSEPS
jgi:hypothetical protein